MQTQFTPAQLKDPAIAEADAILRKCVHCGFCTATCPTYVLLGDEADSPRGRIYAIKDMLEGDKAASPRTATHLDRCLTCLSCMTTCPSGVDYMHLVEIGRAHLGATYRRPTEERWMRRLLTTVLPHPRRFRLALAAARLARPLAGLMPKPLATLMTHAPTLPPEPPLAPGTYPAQGTRRGRVALLAGCVQQVLGTDINAATLRLLTRLGLEVVVASKAGCCGALAHHLGDAAAGRAAALRNVAAWAALAHLDAIVVNASGCGTQVKDYGHLLPDNPQAAAIAGLTKDISEVLAELGFAAGRPPAAAQGMVVAYHPACSLQHGQRVRSQPKALLQSAGFVVREPLDSHLCCGSAGTYSLTQPEIAHRLRDRKSASLLATGAQVVATGNIGCIEHLRTNCPLPIVHTVQLLDWATGGPKPRPL